MLHRVSVPIVSLVLLLAFVLPLAAPAPARADGVIVVEPPGCDPACPGQEPVLVGDQLVVRSHRVDVSIADQVATTQIDQIFHNPNPWAAEGTYLFPLPEGAAVAEFTMWVDGEPVPSKLLDAAEARRIYEEIVRNQRDPALLEYVGEGAIQASVFPIPPGEDRRIEIAYGQVLPAEAGLVRYRYPLNTERFSAAPLEQVSVRVAVESATPIRAVYSPSHDIALDRLDDRRFTAGYEENDVRPTTDFELFYSVSPDPVGAGVASYVDPATGEGTFMLLLAPGIEARSAAIAKDVLVVLDTSGSMEGEKLAQAKEAVAYVLGHLGAEDRFNVVEFSTGARRFAGGLLPVAAATDAADWVRNVPATGGTDINLALLEALAMAEPGRPTTLLFLTDGVPTEGEVDVPSILRNVAAAAPANVRLFAFGVGDDVDTTLLDSLAEAHQGRSTYVRPGDALDEAVSGFYAGISAPVMTDLVLEVDGVATEELYPARLPDLFAGSQAILLGRYRAGGEATITLRGEVDGEPREYRFAERTFAESGGDAFLPRLWATRKIGHLLTQIRLHGEDPELVSAIVDLSVRYGVVTPYTSYLITEDDVLSAAGRERVAQEAFDAAAAPQPAVGAEAVSRAQSSGQMADAEVAAMPAATVVAADGGTIAVDEVVRYVGAATFVLRDGVWTDTRFDADAMVPVRVAFGSEAYFDLLADPALAAAFALGARVLAVGDGVAYEVVLRS